MFERGKKDDGFDQGTDSGSSASRIGQDSAASGTAGRRGEAAIIGRSIKINGDLRGDEDLRIEGDVSGTVELKNNNLTIGKEGKVRADVYAKSIAVDGTTEGDLYASERVVVHVNAQVRGNISAPKVAIEEGARFKGSIEMDPTAVEKALGKTSLQNASKGNSDDKPSRTDSKAAPANGSKKSMASTSSAPGATQQS
ncbi:MAG: polymer-forming cytoskeletal protein [Woeseia sp.]|nr:polymer-forming cytoskeletal protein [Woeseia sp.]